jgi:hypothetical protein
VVAKPTALVYNKKDVNNFIGEDREKYGSQTSQRGRQRLKAACGERSGNAPVSRRWERFDKYLRPCARVKGLKGIII